MRLEELKKGLWGYRKDAVFQYIAQQEEQFTQKMTEKDAQMEQRSQQDRSHIQELEQENRTLKEELSRLRAQQDQISQAILDARSSAEALKAESRAQEETARETIRQALERDLAELAGCDAHSTVILSQVDTDVFRKLGVNMSCEPTYQTKKLYHKR